MAMVLACLLLPRGAAHKKRKISWWDVIMPLGLTALCTGLFIGVTSVGIQNFMLSFAILFAPPVLICFSFKERPLRFALQDRGVLLFHVSNRYLRLDLLLGSLAEELGLSCMEKYESEVNQDNDATRGKAASHYVIIARRQDVLMELADIPNWKKLPGQPDMPIRTDQYSSFHKIIIW